MSAGKLSRIAGSVFVLAAVFGGIGAAASGVEHGTGGTTSVTDQKAVTDSAAASPSTKLQDVIWT
jgi:hypothetical protein